MKSARRDSDNVRIFVGNSKLLGDNISNYAHHSSRCVATKVPLVHGCDVVAIQRALEARVAGVAQVLEKPGISVGVAEFALSGPVLVVKVWCAPAHADPVQDGVCAAIQEALVIAGYSMPAQTAQALSRAG